MRREQGPRFAGMRRDAIAADRRQGLSPIHDNGMEAAA
jgi:hypothetical protein